MDRLELKRQHRSGRKCRTRKKIYGITSRPRISVFRSNRFIYAQTIDDTSGRVLAQSSSLKSSKGSHTSPATIQSGALVGDELGNIMKNLKITTAVFDTNGYKYHGIVKAVAESIRKTGIKL